MRLSLLIPFPADSNASRYLHRGVGMCNCKPGDVAMITWDEEPVISNIGSLVHVNGPSSCDPVLGLTWEIEPVDFSVGHLFIDGCHNDEIRRIEPGDRGIRHPDMWLRPVEGVEEHFQSDHAEELLSV